MRRRITPSPARAAPRADPADPGSGSASIPTAVLLMVAVLAITLAGATTLHAQDTTRLAPIPTGEEGWNGTRALELAERARIRRREPMADSALRNYRADVTGHIYFFIDREDDPRPVLLRADQVALELYWSQPDRVKQVVQGMRSEKQFPIQDFRYYLDRYTVIQNGFDDVIRVGEGRDVRNVIHPLAPQGRNFYDFRLGDSTIIRLPGEPEPIRVYEIQVRPRDFSLPAIVGSLFVERSRGDLVRLAFTFTPASYLDRRNERVEVLLENALWEGKYWLPREQRLLVRREIPELDLDVGSVIRGVLRVTDYDLNIELPDNFFDGREVVMAAGPERLAEYAFDEGLYDAFAEVGLEDPEPGTLDAVDVEAISGRILRERFLRGVPRLRFYAPSASDVVRFDRAEGLVTAGGAAFGVGRSQAYAYGGWAWGSDRPLARLGWRPAGPDPQPRLFAEAYLNRPEELGLRPATSGVLSSVSAALLGRDYRDIVLLSGGTVGRRWGDNQRGRTTIAATAHRVRPTGQAWTHAPGNEDRRFRPVPPTAEGTQLQVTWERDQRRRLGPATASVRPRLEVGFTAAGVTPLAAALDSGVPFETGSYLRARVDADGRWTGSGVAQATEVEARLTAGVGIGATGPHQLWYLGGPGTLPGHPFHAFAGSAAAVADVTVWRTVVPRLVRVRAFGAVGWTGGDAPPPDSAFGVGIDPGRLAPWSPTHTGAPKVSVGAGLGLLHDIVRVDYALRTDTWDGVLILSIDPDLWSFL